MAASGHADQGKIAFELAAMQVHLKVSGVDALSNALRVWLVCQDILVCALIPDVHQAGAILPSRDLAAEIGVLEGGDPPPARPAV